MGQIVRREGIRNNYNARLCCPSDTWTRPNRKIFSKDGKVVTACIDVVEGGKWAGKSSSEDGLVGRRHLVVGHEYRSALIQARISFAFR
jgi:hypothetical protein